MTILRENDMICRYYDTKSDIIVASLHLPDKGSEIFTLEITEGEFNKLELEELCSLIQEDLGKFK